ncbi:hypothetical protein CPB86DRAFT_802615 [Serendipita vermifera]|nr:hypothetical protein CPB86DRAFT_802615 [Serendipita vermifera]
MLWDLNDGKHLYSLEAGNTVHALVFSPNRYWLCAATATCVKIFDLESKSIVDELKVGTEQLEYDAAAPEKSKAEAISLSWSADGQVLFVGYTDNLKYEVLTPTIQPLLMGGDYAMESLLRGIWSDKMKRLAGGEEDQEQRLVLFGQVWDAVYPQILPKDDADNRNKEDDSGTRAFESITDYEVAQTAVSGALYAMVQKKELLRKRFASHTDAKLAVITRNPELAEPSMNLVRIDKILKEISLWHKHWMKPFKGGNMHTHLHEGYNTIYLDALPTMFPDGLSQLLGATIPATQVNYTSLFNNLGYLGIVRNFETLICRVLYQAIESEINNTCKGKWNEPCLKGILEWNKKVLAPWTAAIYATDPELQKTSLYAGDRTIGQKFEFHVFKTLGELRISELFDIISDIEPDAPVLKDLRECLIRVLGRTPLIQSLRTQISKRLLHPGADTSDIITFYISMIRCLRVVDPQGVILYRVADPIRSYLRGRPDTIHHIVTLLINENSELAQEDQAPIVPEMEHEDYSDPKWIPEPRDAGPRFRTLRPTDLISTLKRQIEILKLRFGDAALQAPDVMLSDMQASSRLSRQIDESSEGIIKAAVVSRWFWPDPPELDKFKMPGQFARLQEEFGKKYEQIKPDKRLHWVHQMGTLKLAIELKDRTIEVTATPLEAAVIELFSEKPTWSQVALSEALGVKEQTVIGALISWNEEGILEYSEYQKMWTLVEEGDASRTKNAEADYSAVVMQQIDTTKQSSDEPVDSRDQQEWLHIKRALTNFGGGLSTARIHSLLKYSPNPKTMPQLEALLERLQAERLIEGIEGVWSIAHQPRHAPMLPPHWDPHQSVEHNIRVITQENRLQTIQCQQQIKEMQLLIADLLKRVEESETRTFRQLSALASEIGKRTEDIGHIRQQLRSSNADWWCTSAASTPASRTINIETPSPTTTAFSDPSLEQSDIDDKWDVPNWLSEEGPRHPYKSHTSLYTARTSEIGEKTNSSTSDEATFKMHHELPDKHDLDDIVHSPYGPANLETFLTAEQKEKLMIRRMDDDDHTMRFISEECDRYPIVLGGLNEPIIAGRFRDEKDVHQASIFRSRRWGLHPNLLLRRLPSRDLLLPDDPLLVPAHVLHQRRKTWFLTYRIWYRFVATVGPSRFPGLLDTSWEAILSAPPEDTRAAFADAIQQYMGYTGTRPSGSLPGQNWKGRRLDSLIPYLLDAFDNAVKNPWHHRGLLSDLIVDLDDFAVQRELEVVDSAYLWRGVLTNTFPKLCLKHIKMGSVGGSDPRWPVVQAEYSERLGRRCKLWSALSQYRFPQGCYLPNGKIRTSLDRNIKMKQLVNESISFARVMMSWKDGAVGVKNRILPQLEIFEQREKPLEDSELEGWIQLVSSLQAFYASKTIHTSANTTSPTPLFVAPGKQPNHNIALGNILR